MIKVTIEDPKKDGDNTVIESDGCLVMYIKDGTIQFAGKINMSAVAPLIGKALLEKMVK